MPIKVHAAYEPITAAECEVADGFDPSAPLTAGQCTQLVIQVRAPPSSAFPLLPPKHLLISINLATAMVYFADMNLVSTKLAVATV
jgi:hypothetical protein